MNPGGIQELKEKYKNETKEKKRNTI